MIAVPYQTGGIVRYGVGLFMMCWLVGWAFGWFHASSEIVAGRGNLFMVGWLGAWTVGGGFAAFTLYRILRGDVPEVFRLMPQGLRYDSGVAPLDMMAMTTANRSNWNWNSYFTRRIRADLDRQQLKTLQLRQTPTGNRLTIDAGAARLDLARDATEIEREWLYQVLAERYSLAPPAQQERT